MDTFYWHKFFLVMFSMIAADVCWTYYFIKVEERKPLAAGLWGSVIVLFSAFITTNYVDDKSYVFAAFLGALIGTTGTVWFKRRQETKDKEKTQE
jgi:hypothetical protein